MNIYRADLHIHTVLSPCGDLEMSPSNIVNEAVRKGLDIIAVTDHNHTGHTMLARQLGAERDIWVVYGVEVTSKEEVHCLAFFDSDDQVMFFQNYIESKISRIANNKSFFGEQLIVDKEENILEEVEYSLYPGLNSGISEIADQVHLLGGLFVPAHVDRKMNGLYSQLGIFPEDLSVDAVEIFRNTNKKRIVKEKRELMNFQLLKNSDAHFIQDIGRAFNLLQMENRSFKELAMAFHGEKGRMVIDQ